LIAPKRTQNNGRKMYELALVLELSPYFKMCQFGTNYGENLTVFHQIITCLQLQKTQKLKNNEKN